MKNGNRSGTLIVIFLLGIAFLGMLYFLMFSDHFRPQPTGEESGQAVFGEATQTKTSDGAIEVQAEVAVPPPKAKAEPAKPAPPGN